MKKFLKTFIISGLLLAQEDSREYGLVPFREMVSRGIFRGGEAGQFIVDMVTWMMSIIGAVAIAFIVWGAVMYVTSAGREKQIETAKRILLYAIIGFIIAILAVVILQVVGRVVIGEEGAAYPCEELHGGQGYRCVSERWKSGCVANEVPHECCVGVCITDCAGDFCCGTGELCCCKD